MLRAEDMGAAHAPESSPWFVYRNYFLIATMEYDSTILLRDDHGFDFGFELM